MRNDTWGYLVTAKCTRTYRHSYEYTPRLSSLFIKDVGEGMMDKMPCYNYSFWSILWSNSNYQWNSNISSTAPAIHLIWEISFFPLPRPSDEGWSVCYWSPVGLMKSIYVPVDMRLPCRHAGFPSREDKPVSEAQPFLLSTRGSSKVCRRDYTRI